MRTVKPASVFIVVIVFSVPTGAAACDHISGDSVMSVVRELSECFLDRSVEEDREFIAAIYRQSDAGVERFHADVQAGYRHGDKVSIRLRRSKRRWLVAMWHTHGAPGAARELFSQTDIAVVSSLGKPFYLTDPNGRVRRLDPGAGVRRARLTRSLLKVAGASGVLVR